MALENTRALLKAMSANAELLDVLSNVVEEPYFYPKGGADKTLALLQSAGLIEEIEESYYLPGDNIDALQQILNTSSHASTVKPELEAWKSAFKNECLQYRSLAEQALSDSSINPATHLQKVRNVCIKLVNVLRRELRDIDAHIGSNMNNFPRQEDKIRQSEYYLAELGKTQDDYLTRLIYQDLMKLSSSPETDAIAYRMSRDLDGIRENLKRVLNRVSDFNFHVKLLSKRKENLSRTFNQLMSGELKLDAEMLSNKEMLPLDLMSDEELFVVSPNLAATELTGVEEGVLNDLIHKANIEPLNGGEVVVEEMSATQFFEELPPIDMNTIKDEFQSKFNAVSSSFLRDVRFGGKPASIMGFWSSTDDAKDVSPNAWLYVMGSMVFEVQSGLDFGQELLVKTVKESRSDITSISILRDLIVEYREQK